MAFADKIVELYQQLEKIGHQPQITEQVFGIADGTDKKIIHEMQTDHGDCKRRRGFIKIWHDLIKSGDAVLVCNFDKNNIKNYIGGNTLMEIAFAHVNNKKVFLYNPIPEEVQYLDELNAMVDCVLAGDLIKIK